MEKENILEIARKDMQDAIKGQIESFIVKDEYGMEFEVKSYNFRDFINGQTNELTLSKSLFVDRGRLIKDLLE
ncbi:hypothetical protein CMU14_13190 [Elizabethkingia anophelis]|nr:hypothetical protein [Elizabethkingia anophelis]